MSTIFAPATSSAAGVTPDSATTADMNGNGVPDLAVAELPGCFTVLLGTGSGGFTAAPTYAGGGNPGSMMTVDVNGS